MSEKSVGDVRREKINGPHAYTASVWFTDFRAGKLKASYIVNYLVQKRKIKMKSYKFCILSSPINF